MLKKKLCVWVSVCVYVCTHLNLSKHSPECLAAHVMLFLYFLGDAGRINSANAKYLNCSFVTHVLSFLSPCPHHIHSVSLFLFSLSISLTPPPSVAGVAVAQRVVTVESGPLIRTEGSHVTIWCNVTGYKEGVEQDFEWSMYLPSAPDREIRIVSTAQPNYAYAVYAQRVNSKEIYVERLSRDSAVLHITKVQAKDQGLFECYTPNTDGRYLGSYSARTNLTGESLSTHTHTHTHTHSANVQINHLRVQINHMLSPQAHIWL